MKKYFLDDKILEPYNFQPEGSKYSQINGVVEECNNYWVMEPWRDFGEKDLYMEGSGFEWIFLFEEERTALEFIKNLSDPSIKGYQIDAGDNRDVIIKSKVIDNKIIIEGVGWDSEYSYWENNFLLDLDKRVPLK